MGDQDAYPEERPARDVCVDSFEIGRTEITNGQFSAFVEATGYVTSAERDQRETGLPPGSTIFDPDFDGGTLSWWKHQTGASWKHPYGPDARPAKRNEPVVHVTFEDAVAYADWMGARLLTEAEWEFAAQITAVTEQDSIEPRANIWTGLFPVHNTQEDGFEGIAPVGQFPSNDSGLYDMTGNVWEWTSSPYTPSHAENDRQLAGPNGLDFTQPGVAVGVIKGGSFLCASNYCARFRPAARQAQDLRLSASHIGFRVARSN